MSGTSDPCESLNALKIAELEKRLGVHLSYQKEMVDKAAVELHERLATMNEFREQLKDQAATFVKRETMDMSISTLEKRLAMMEKVLLAGLLAGLLTYAIK